MAIRGRWVGTLEMASLKLENKTIKTKCFKQPALQVGRWSLGSRRNDQNETKMALGPAQGRACDKSKVF